MRLMLDIAMHDAAGPVRIKDVAARQEISDKYLEQIVSVLNKAGYVRSIRGPQGGYQLIRKPKDYTVGMILRLTEGSLAPVGCLEYGENDCPRQEMCATLKLWKMLVNELVRHGKIFSQISYPMRSHGIYEGEGTSLHLRKTMADYWLKNLPAGGK
mgnify:CR=1 FL=1